MLHCTEYTQRRNHAENLVQIDHIFPQSIDLLAKCWPIRLNYWSHDGSNSQLPVILLTIGPLVTHWWLQLQRSYSWVSGE